jgi:hypothetical protein
MVSRSCIRSPDIFGSIAGEIYQLVTIRCPLAGEQLIKLAFCIGR